LSDYETAMRTMFLSATWLIATAAVATPTSRLTAGLAAYAAHDFAGARRIFTALADDGSAIGETMLGTIYARGQGVRRDPAAAAAYYFRAANRGYAPAQLAFGRALARGEGLSIDRDEAAMWLHRATERGDARVVAAARRDLAGLGDSDSGYDRGSWRPWPGAQD